MPYYNKSTRDVAAALGLGLRVDRAAQTIPQSTDYDIFTVYGMNLMTLLVGECTVTVGGAHLATLTFTPTTGSAAILAAQTDIGTAAWVEGDICFVSGAIGDNILPAAHASKSDAAFASLVLNGNGVINLAGSTNVAGAFAWSIWYVPLEAGAYIAVA
jgi:hypothetical protein